MASFPEDSMMKPVHPNPPFFRDTPQAGVGGRDRLRHPLNTKYERPTPNEAVGMAIQDQQAAPPSQSRIKFALDRPRPPVMRGSVPVMELEEGDLEKSADN
ncbi:hypothetical protein N7468_002378 [Penicillium chermesinum]|uniref:Uncharacterized protein n=1 Tax=Penicillium chermesinum TaxID=63820 RepID=A0A9W9PII8_9EURO|nr:uncharacterized protein N7468_002378 [Penicillium chermesinum]KAJ5247395.1 hypothetical protein N7468_002378 [Penicillium chermesinum]